jgi:hypothetical protein
MAPNEPICRIIGDEAIEFNAALSKEQRAKQLDADQYLFFGFPGWSRNMEANRSLPIEYMHPPHADMTCVAHARSVFEAMINELLEQNGLFGRPQYKRYKKFGSGTPSGKVEFCSTTFGELGCEPVPVYREPPHSPLEPLG